jgi:hypothetical protein
MATKAQIAWLPICRLQYLLLSLWTFPSGPFLEAGNVRDSLFTQSKFEELKEEY